MIATTYRQEAPHAPWWARRSAARHHDRPAEVLAVLQHARAVVEAGWIKNGWTRPTPAPALAAAPRSSVAVQATGDGTPAACVVAAVALAVRARHPRADLAVATGPALAYLHDAVYGHARVRRAAGRAAPHQVRVDRMRELARWNDEPTRTHADVVDALDRAAARVVALTVEPTRA